MKNCNKCKTETEKLTKGMCHKCYNLFWYQSHKEITKARAKLWKKGNPQANKEYKKRNREKENARWKAEDIIKKTGIKSYFCSKCGVKVETELHAHHLNYKHNIVIYGFCPNCHNEFEKQIKEYITKQEERMRKARIENIQKARGTKYDKGNQTE